MRDVIVVGGGPVGLWTAGELARRRLSVTLIERLDQVSPHSKALTVHPRTLELLAQRALIEEPAADGIPITSAHFAQLVNRTDLGVLDTPYPYTLMYSQEDVELLLERAARALGVDIRRGHEVTEVADRGDSVTVTVRAPGSGAAGPLEPAHTLECRYIVGADGARSTVRAAAGIAFDGARSPGLGTLADVRLDAPPARGALSRYTEDGGINIVPLNKGGLHRIVVGAGAPALAGVPEPTFAMFREAVRRIAGTDFGMRDPVWFSSFGNSARLAATYRKGRILLAGDAAHIHSPSGGVGMNVGLQDAGNLAWRLADVLTGYADDSALDDYHAERHPVGVALLRDTKAQFALRRFDREGLALRTFLDGLIGSVPAFSRALAERIAGFAVRYPAWGAHPLCGTRAPDVPLKDTTLFPALTGASPLLLLRAEAPPALREATAERAIEVHTLAPDPLRPEWNEVTAALVRPDGFLHWASAEPDPGALAAEALTALSSLRTLPGARA
ncbi:FAD-dependent oxidoreductase [Streptomyces sp. NPDC004610]|uniref:FAD-dependent oxidoreductase n=1 Tax=unclassified Streptomyces TaxID=2593676 RepID=UPI0033B9C5D1